MNIPKIVSRLRELLPYWGVPGLSVTLGYRGKILTSEAYGYADVDRAVEMHPDHRFRLGSMTKLFTMTCTLKLVEEGLFSLDCPIVELFGKKGYTINQLGDPRVTNITLRHLLGHTSGLPFTVNCPPETGGMLDGNPYNTPYPPTIEAVLMCLQHAALEFAPGTAQQYSTFAYTVVGRLIEAYVGTTYYAYLQQSVLGPGGLSSVVVGKTEKADRPDDEAVYYRIVNDQREQIEGFDFGGKYIEARDSTGGLISTTSDIVRLIMLLEGSAQPALLRASSIKEMIRAPACNKTEKSYLGMGCYVSIAECGMLDRIHGRLSGIRISQNGRSTGMTGLFYRSPRGYICVAFLNGIGENSENMDRQLYKIVAEGFE